MIMQSEDRELVCFPERDRPVLTEQDLESNFELVRDVAYTCFELHLELGSIHEIPILAEFEAGWFVKNLFGGPVLPYQPWPWYVPCNAPDSGRFTALVSSQQLPC